MVNYLLPAVLLIQFILIASGLLFSMRKWDISARSGIYRFIAYIMALFALAGIIIIAYFPFPVQQEEIALNIEQQLGQTNNFVPFRSILGYAKEFCAGYESVLLFQCIGNIVLFLPYGFFVSIINWKRKKQKRTVFFICFFTSLSIELMQGMFNLLLGYCYRSVDVDDLILNIFGGMLGSVLADFIYKSWFSKSK